LAAASNGHIATRSISVAVERQWSAFGQKYEVDGILRGPSGREARVTTIWIVKNGEDFPRLVTVYPGDGQ
jgi:hypothetical protein